MRGIFIFFPEMGLKGWGIAQNVRGIWSKMRGIYEILRTRY